MNSNEEIEIKEEFDKFDVFKESDNVENLKIGKEIQLNNEKLEIKKEFDGEPPVPRNNTDTEKQIIEKVEIKCEPEFYFSDEEMISEDRKEKVLNDFKRKRVKKLKNKKSKIAIFIPEISTQETSSKGRKLVSKKQVHEIE